MTLDRLRVLAFRAASHNLGTRLAAGDVAKAVGAVGIRDAKGSAILSLHARVEGVTGDRLDGALKGGELADVLSTRGTRTIVPVDDVGPFTLGTMPADEESLRARLKPFLPVLDQSGYTAIEAVELAKKVARKALADGPVDIGVLSGALTRALPELSPMCRGRCKVAHIETGLFDLVGESGVWRHEQMDGLRMYVPMKEPGSRKQARAELVRRYLRCYGPSTAADFAAWCGISRGDAARSLESAGTTEVAMGRYLLTEDVERYESPRKATGIRILPPHDPYLMDRDRATLVPDREVQKRVWRATPTDGLILAAGVPVASWRPKKKGKHLVLNVEPFAKMTKPTLSALRDETTAVAEHRGCTSAEVCLVQE
ncbi:MAG: winged helix DNA-binding domain-containing protein [Actinobacteria bacterium]|nr:winged helix DNA-binding domain-containing protein [Actinomycetota bacterium]